MLNPYGNANKSFPEAIKLSHGKKDGLSINETTNGTNHSDCMIGKTLIRKISLIAKPNKNLFSEKRSLKIIPKFLDTSCKLHLH